MPVLEAPESEYTVHFKFPEVEKLSPPIIQMSGLFTFLHRKNGKRILIDHRGVVRIYSRQATIEEC